MKKLNVIITGATGMVGEGVLHECVLSAEVENVLIVSRKHYEISNPKVKEVLVKDFFDLKELQNHLNASAIKYNTCFFCLGVTSIGKKEDEYTRFTYDLTLNFGRLLHQLFPEMFFGYISGASTDSSEKGRMMWARVKGKTENDLMKLFPNAYMFRPGYMQPTKGLKNTIKGYRYVSWMYPFFKIAFRNSVSSLAEMGQAMINCALHGYEKKILEVKDILKISHNV